MYPIAFSGLTSAGHYHITVDGDSVAASPEFWVLNTSLLYSQLVRDGVSFFQVQRDGADLVAGPLGRVASHLHDAHADIYAWPTFESPDSDVITDADLTRIGGPADVAGGWFDAGDYLKLTHSAAFGNVVLLASLRALGDDAPAGLSAEAHFGTAWLSQMWNQKAEALMLQVGIGSGNTAGTFTGDHGLWRLPQADDHDSNPVDRYAAAHRPAFLAAPPGSPISPNLAGRVSAAFALAAQVDAAGAPRQAAAEWRAATSLYAMAATQSPPDPLVTALPNAFYPESTWHDDMELAATEIALAAQRAVLVADLKRQLQTGASRADSDLFHTGGIYNDFDVDSHMFGLLTTEALYRAISGDDSFSQFATEQRNWLLGANPWGSSFMVGVGDTFPHCMQHQVANLSGSTDGTPPSPP